MSNKTSTMLQGCIFTVLSLGTAYFYYTLMPKSDYMLLHLTTPEQNQLWLNIYKHMKTKCHVGFLIGMVGYFFLAYGICPGK